MNTPPALLGSIVLLLCTISCRKETLAKPATTDDIFVWDRPTLAIDNRPIAKSATCRFKQSLDATYYHKVTNEEPNSPARVYYGNGPENESDTVSFINLDSAHPIVQSNGG